MNCCYEHKYDHNTNNLKICNHFQFLSILDKKLEISALLLQFLRYIFGYASIFLFARIFLLIVLINVTLRFAILHDLNEGWNAVKSSWIYSIGYGEAARSVFLGFFRVFFRCRKLGSRSWGIPLACCVSPPKDDV